jgi:hypothetical protein
MVHYTHERLTDSAGSVYETGIGQCCPVAFIMEPVRAASHPKNTSMTGISVVVACDLNFTIVAGRYTSRSTFP